MWASPGRLSTNSPLPGGITRASNSTALTTLGSASSCRHHRLHLAISSRFLRLFGKNGGRLSTSAARWRYPEDAGSTRSTRGNRPSLFATVNDSVFKIDSFRRDR